MDEYKPKIIKGQLQDALRPLAEKLTLEREISILKFVITSVENYPTSESYPYLDKFKFELEEKEQNLKELQRGTP